jgi:hypothetical protein
MPESVYGVILARVGRDGGRRRRHERAEHWGA